MTDTNASAPKPETPTSTPAAPASSTSGDASAVAAAVATRVSSAVTDVVTASDAHERHWVYIQRQYGPDLMVGPYESLDVAADACTDALLIDGLVEEDCLDCFTTTDRPTAEEEQILIDPNDKDHFGRPGIHAQYTNAQRDTAPRTD